MKRFTGLETFTDRYPLVGPVVWMTSLQYYVTQLIVAGKWPVPYSWLHNTISDLGNTACGMYDGRYVCSPFYSWMNASFVTLGIAMIAGSSLIYREFRKEPGSSLGFYLMALAGLGTILVGFSPENTNHILHELGAALPFVFGNVALLLFGWRLPLPRGLRLFTLTFGVVALIALGLFLSHQYVGLGIGGMERIVAYPQSIWLIAFGLYMSRNHFMLRR